MQENSYLIIKTSTMKKLFTLFLSVYLISAAFAQKPEAIALKTLVKPVIDGVLDEEGTWDNANVYNIALPFNGETPTLGNVGETNYRVLWDDDGIFVFVTVTDDVFVPNFSNTGAGYMYDFPEITFDVNYVLNDGEGPQEGNGHYQIDPKIFEADVNGTAKIGSEQDNETVAFLVNDPNYTAEYFIPFSTLKDRDGKLVDKTQEIGFDVYVVDNDNTADLNDPIRNRAVWTNQGLVTEAWDSMDDCGILLLDGSEPPIPVDEINLAGEDITVNGEAMQLAIEIYPEDADDKNLKWIIEGVEGGIVKATVSPEGLITPIVDETFTIQATSSDEFTYSNIITVNISGQKPTRERLNYIKNGNFDEVDSTGVPLKWSGFEAGTATVVDGVLEFAPSSVKSNIYDYKMLQILHIPYEVRELDYVLSFKAWADEERSFQLKIEDSANGWATYGVSSDETSNGQSLWPADLMRLTTEPTNYELHMTFANMAENCNQNFNWQVGDSDVKIHLDSVYLLSVADLGLISTAATPDYKAEADFMVYPNPAVNKLHIELSTVNTQVSIYNSVGIKMEETVVNGTHHTFDISRYAQGMYFVKANEGIRKFIK